MSEAEATKVTGNAMSAEELESDAQEVWEEIMDFVIWEFCIEVHRATKLNYLHLDPALDPNYDENQKREIAAKDIPSQEKPDDLVCPKCNKEYVVEKYLGKHMPKCMGLVPEKRGSLKKKRQESDTKFDTTDNTGRKTSQKSRGQRKTKSSACGSSLKSPGEDIDTFKNMTYGEKNQFLGEKQKTLARSKKRYNIKDAQDTCEAKENPENNAGNDQMNDYAEGKKLGM